MANNNKENFLLLYASCFPVNGISRSIIVDTQRGEMYFIDNHLHEILIEARKKSWADICDEYDADSQEMLNGYVKFLEEHELCHWTDTPDAFPEIDLYWDSPSIITNAIIDSNEHSNHDWKDIFEQLINLGCRDIQLRFFSPINMETINAILLLVDDSYIKSVEFILPYSKAFSKKYLNKLIDEHVRIKYFTFYNAPKDEMYRPGNGSGMGHIIYVTEKIESEQHCGIINMAYFNLREPRVFAEFKSHNSCLNRKVGIDVEGNIKNCPSLKTVYGNIRETKIESVLTPEFKRIWDITKDQIEICKICEFRYICSDCRAYVSDSENELSKPKKCNYDPVSMEWK